MGGVAGAAVLVTGATGFIGRHLVQRLVDDGAAVWAVSRRSGAEREAPVTRVLSSLDELSLDTWRRLGAPRFDLVFHLGAYTPKSPDGANDLAQVFSGNIAGTHALLTSLAARPERVVFASTLDVYAPVTAAGVLAESSPTGPVSLYGQSKLFCEGYVRHWAEQCGVGCSVLRYGHVFGPGEEAYRKLIPESIRRLLSGEAPVIYGDGDAQRDLIYVDDVLEATVRAATLDAHAAPINVVRGESVSVRRVIEMLVHLTGFTGYIESRAGGSAAHSFRFDNALMRSMLGTWPMVDLEEGLRREVESMR